MTSPDDLDEADYEPRPPSCFLPGLALMVAALATLWWPIVGVGTENFGSDCLWYFGETGAVVEHCHAVNDRAREWIPRLVLVAWLGAGLALLALWSALSPRVVGAAVAVASGGTAIALGAHAMVVSTP